MAQAKDSRAKSNLEFKNDANVRGGSSAWTRVGIYSAIVVAAFLLGLIPMWLSNRETANQRNAAQANLRLSQMQNRLATAAIDVRRGEYEAARQSASDFFTDLRAEVDRQNSVLNQQQQTAVQPILAARDDTITLLARNDPASADRLADLYVAFRQIIDLAAAQR